MKAAIPLLAVVLSISNPCSLRADVKLPSIFGDHMVLQQETTLPVWGTADPGEKVTVTVGLDSGSTTAGSDGKWMVKLPPLPNATPAMTMTVTGKNNLTFSDVLAGDVWICSGQSNMVYPMQGAYNPSPDIHAATDTKLRYFLVGHHVAITPDTDLPGKWMVCTPALTNGFSAVAYYFARELRSSVKHPIGLIGSYWPGVPCQTFISLSGLQKYPPFTSDIAVYQKDLDAYPQVKAAYPAALADYQDKLKKWNDTVAPGYNAILKQWQDAVKSAKANGQAAPPLPVPSTPKPVEPPEPGGHAGAPSILFNGMIAPLIPYAIKGAIWYQGESNTKNGAEYQGLLSRLINDWRARWNEGDFPFLFVQLPNYGAPQKNPSEGGWAYLRESQLKTLALPNTGMAITIDLGGPGDLHPKDKLDVGMRLALVARHVAYAQDLVYSGPIYDSMKIEGSKIRLSFKDTGGGLIMGTSPWTPTGVPAPAPTKLTGFSIAGADQNWVWANAQIDGNTVLVSSDQVPSPTAVRHGWGSNPACDLYNKEGLPASPFRTDDFPPPVSVSAVAPVSTPSIGSNH